MRDVGENRHQEAEDKAARARRPAALTLALRRADPDQQGRRDRRRTPTSCTRSTRSGSAQRLNAGAHQRDRLVDCLVQVSLDPSRGETPVAEAWRRPTVGDRRRRDRRPREGCGCGGVMGVAPLGGDADAAYARLAEVAAELLVVTTPTRR